MEPEAYARMGYIDEVELSDRQRTILKLRFHFGRGPAEIQRHLGVTERVYRRELDRALEHVARSLERGRCDSQHARIIEASAVSERRPSRASRLIQRPEPAAACIAAAVVACGGVSHAAVQPASTGEVPASAHSPAPEVTLVAHRRRAHRPHRPAGEFGPEARRQRQPLVSGPTQPEFGLEVRPLAPAPAPPTPEELEFGLEGPGR